MVFQDENTLYALPETLLPTAGTSLLGADFGSVHTRAVFIDQVDGQYRLVSRAQALTTADAPYGDVTVGLGRALDQMTALIGRGFLAGDRIAIGPGFGAVGAEQFVATASGGRPMRAVLVGLMADVSLASGKHALGSVYTDLADVISIGDLRSEEAKVNAILGKRPDLIFIVGGTDFGAQSTLLALVKTVRLALSLLPAENRPIIVYAGNEAMRETVTILLTDLAEVFPAANVRPALNREYLAGAELELAVAYGRYKAMTGGYRDMPALTRLGVLPTASSYSTIIRYLGGVTSGGVLALDIGSSTVTIAASLAKRGYLNIRPDLGVGHSAVSAVEQIGAERVLRWLTYKSSVSDVLDYVYNKTLKPATIPGTPEELEMEFALAREIAREALESARRGWPRRARIAPFATLIGAGAVLTQALDPGLSAMLLLDAVQPAGIVRLQSDPYAVIPALGAAAYMTPLVAVQVLESGGLLDLGTALCTEGVTRAADAMQIDVKYSDGRTASRIVPNNAFRLIDLPGGQRARITVRLARGLTISGKSRLTLDVDGGAAGIICDTRGRPLRPPADLGKRRDLLVRWFIGARAAVTQAPRAETSGPAPTDEENP